uniref:Threonylcarbamoyl-AMP synthase n=1 Tax=Anopheles farauti TaxID=69004 RepID=A0A1Y9H9F2_9DIPT
MCFFNRCFVICAKVKPLFLLNATTRFQSTFAMRETVIRTTNAAAVQKAVHFLRQGKVIALPTDTVYGLACSAVNKKAVRQLYVIKERDELKPVAICVATIQDLKHWGEADHLQEELLHELLPGAVTIVVRKSSRLNNHELVPGESKIGIRITNSEFIQDVCAAFGSPVALTSANKSSSQSTLNVREFKNLWHQLGAVFDGGQLGQSEKQRAASTVIDLSVPGKYTIIRAGVAVEKTISVVQKYNIYPD